MTKHPWKPASTPSTLAAFDLKVSILPSCRRRFDRVVQERCGVLRLQLPASEGLNQQL